MECPVLGLVYTASSRPSSCVRHLPGFQIVNLPGFQLCMTSFRLQQCSTSSRLSAGYVIFQASSFVQIYQVLRLPEKPKTRSRYFYFPIFQKLTHNKVKILRPAQPPPPSPTPCPQPNLLLPAQSPLPAQIMSAGRWGLTPTRRFYRKAASAADIRGRVR